MNLFCLKLHLCCLTTQESPAVNRNVVSVESSSVLHDSIKPYFFVYRDAPFTIKQTEQPTKCFESFQKLGARLAS